MQFRKIIAVWGILALAIVQIAMAQHSAVHPDHGLSLPSAQHGGLPSAHGEYDEHEKAPLADHECPECALIKALQTAFYAGHAFNSEPAAHKQTFPTPQTPHIPRHTESAYNPRAPPAYLI